MTYIEIASADGGSFNAYLATPASGNGPGLVVIQEIFGINPAMRSIADAYAAQGYVALVPDLFWRQQPGVELNDRSQADWAKAFEFYQSFDEAMGVQDLIAALNQLRELSYCTGKVGTVGFCLGGKMAYLMAARSDADCNVSYYGVTIEQNLDESNNIQKPLLMHIAEQDKFVSPEVQEQIKNTLSGNPAIAIHSYPGVDHAFARIGGEPYVAEAAELANNRTIELFQTYLT